MNPTQSNTQAGRYSRTTGAVSLVGKEGFLCLIARVGGKGVVALPAALGDITPFIVDEGGAPGEPTTIDPLNPDRQYRIKALGAGNAGQILALANPAVSADAGKVRALPAAAGVYVSPGVAEEDFVDGQLVLMRPLLRLVRVNAVAAMATADGAIAALPIGGAYVQAEVVALRNATETLGDDVRAIHAALLAQGIIRIA